MIKASATSVDVKSSSGDSLEYDKGTGIMNISYPKEHKIYGVRCGKQPNTFQKVKQKSSNIDSLNKEDINHILLDKRKSWAVEELVAELSKVRTERNHHEFPSTEFEDEKHRVKDSVTSSSSHMYHSTVHSSPDDKISSSKYVLSLESDKAGISPQQNKGGSEVSCISGSEEHCKVCPVPLEGSEHVGKVTHKLSESLEKLAQEIQFQPVATVTSGNAQSNFLGCCNEPRIVVDSAVDNTKMESAFGRIKSKLSYSSSFKTRKEMQQVLKRRNGNSVLSTSWENALSESKKIEDSKVTQDKNKLTSEHVLSSFKEQVDLGQCPLKASHSGSDLEALSVGVVPQKALNQHWNLVRHHVFHDKMKVVSGSESEETVDECVYQDEGSISGLSDDIVLCQGGTSKGYSDISDGAVSDDLLIESSGKSKGGKKGDPSSGMKLQKKSVSLSRKNKVRSL